MIVFCCSFTPCVLDGQLYVAGGMGSSELHVWDHSAWQRKADLSDMRYDAACVAYKGMVMVIGGMITANNLVEGLLWVP